MKKVITLSFATATIIGLTGCGGGASSPELIDENLSSITLGSNNYKATICHLEQCEDIEIPSRYYEKNRVILIKPKEEVAPLYEKKGGKSILMVPKDEREITLPNAIANTIAQQEQIAYKEAKKILTQKGFSEQKVQSALLKLLQKTQEIARAYGAKEVDAYEIALEIIAQKALHFEQGESILKEETIEGIEVKPREVLSLIMTKPITLIFREMQQLKEHYNTFQCRSENDTKDYILHGYPDQFSPLFSSLEQPTPQTPMPLSQLSFDSNVANSIASGYFTDTLSSIPNNIYTGELVISLRSGKGFMANRYLLGDLSNITTNSTPLKPISNITNWSTISPKVYYKSLNTVQSTTSNNTLLTEIQNGTSKLDFATLYDTDVNFWGMLFCQREEPKPDPIPPTVSCNTKEGETLIQVTAGVADDFAMPIDPTTPSSALATLTSGNLEYDQPALRKENKLIDTIDLSTALGGQTITKLNLLLNIKLSSSNYNNSDFIGYGQLGQLPLNYGTTPSTITAPPTANGGKAVIINGSTPLFSPGTTLKSIANSNQAIDLYVRRYTMVDYARVDMCVVDTKPQESDLNITKEISKISQTTNGYNIDYTINVGGYLPAGESIVVNDTVPNGGTFTNVTAPDWNCTNTPINSGGTLSCSITGAYTSIPPINITMSIDKPNRVENCAAIVKGIGTYYDTNIENDKSCVTYTAPLPRSCNKNIHLDLSQASSWRDSSGTQPIVNNPVPNSWDSNMSWFDFGMVNYATESLYLNFCSCGGGEIKIDEMKADNNGSIQLDNSTIVQRVGIAQSNFNTSSPNVSAFSQIPSTGSGANHQLKFSVTNKGSYHGGAVDGTLTFIGHLGECTEEDQLLAQP